MRTPVRIALFPAAAALASSIALATPAIATPLSVAGTDRLALDAGHVDVIGIAYEDGQFDLHVHDEDNDVEYAPDEVRFVAKPTARTTVPADPAFAFLGAPGDPVWVLPQVQDPELLWPGIGAEEIEPGVFTDDALTLRVLRVQGPDEMSVFTTDGVGTPAVLVDSGDGLPDTVPVTAGDHVHANWAFEAPGRYDVTVRVSGTLAATGERVTSASATYRFQVRR